MSRISSTGITTSSGLISGIPIEETVEQLVAVSSRPRNQLASRVQGLAAERNAVDQLASLTLGVGFSLSRLTSASTYLARNVSSSDPSAVTATVAAGSTATPGSYQFTPLRQAASHQLVSNRLEDLSSLGNGSISFGYGGHVDGGVELSELNDGAGFTGGQIKITDRDGATAVIDLRGAQNVDDVLAEINNSADIDVTASVSGDRFVLTDSSGGSGTLRVREVNGGTAAESLGLLGTAAGDTLTGEDVYGLSITTELSRLNDGLGVDLGETIEIQLNDDTTLATVDLSDAETIGDVLDAINNHEDLEGLLTASINSDGDGLTLVDSTAGTGTLRVTDAEGGTAAADLGIATSGATGTLEGDRVLAGLKDTLVASFNAGAGIELGEIEITTRDGAGPTTIDLSGAETLGDIVDLINASGADVSASVNASRNGLVISDESGGNGSLVVANGASGTTADDLGISIDAASASVDSGSLGRQTVSRSTLLSEFNSGRGVSVSDIRVTDSSGSSTTINLDDSDDPATTIGDVIDRINNSGLGVEARINDTGDGILLTDTADGSSVLSVEEVGSGTAAADLGLLGDSTTTDDEDRQTIDGSTRTTISLEGIENSPEATSLSSLNGGAGVNLGLFQVSNGVDSFVVDLGASGAVADAETIGDVIDRINEAAEGTTISARVNDAQSGIIVEDTATGQELTITDLGGGTAAEDLNLVRTAADTNDAVIDGAGLFTFNGDNALQLLADRINEADAGVTASVFPDGDGFRLSISSNDTGADNELLIDGFGTQLSFLETSRPSDAVALYGGFGGVGGFALTSQDGNFNDVIDGVNLSVEQATGEPVTIDVKSNQQPVVDAVNSFISAYNSLRDNIDSVTDFDAATESTGILFGRGEVVRVDTELSRLVTDRYFVGGSFTSLQDIGIRVDSEGKLSLNESDLREAISESPGDVEDLFKNEERGVVARFNEATDRLAGDESSLLGSRSEAITRTIESNEERISDWDARLERQRETLTLEFIALEQAIALLQSNLDTISEIQPISIVSSNNNN